MVESFHARQRREREQREIDESKDPLVLEEERQNKRRKMKENKKHPYKKVRK